MGSSMLGAGCAVFSPPSCLERPPPHSAWRARAPFPADPGPLSAVGREGNRSRGGRGRRGGGWARGASSARRPPRPPVALLPAHPLLPLTGGDAAIGACAVRRGAVALRPALPARGVTAPATAAPRPPG